MIAVPPTVPHPTVVPIRMNFHEQGRQEQLFGPEPESATQWGVFGLWLYGGPDVPIHFIERCEVVDTLENGDQLGEAGSPLILPGTPAASYDAAPRDDGLPRHVPIDVPLIFGNKKLRFAVSALPLSACPDLVGHLLVRIYPDRF